MERMQRQKSSMIARFLLLRSKLPNKKNWSCRQARIMGLDAVHLDTLSLKRTWTGFYGFLWGFYSVPKVPR